MPDYHPEPELEPTPYNKAHDEANAAARNMVLHYVTDFLGSRMEERSIQIAKERLHQMVDIFVDDNVRLLKESRQIGGQ